VIWLTRQECHQMLPGAAYSYDVGIPDVPLRGRQPLRALGGLGWQTISYPKSRQAGPEDSEIPESLGVSPGTIWWAVRVSISPPWD